MNLMMISLMKTLKREIKEFFRSVKHLIKWFPVIWKDRDWDHYYLLTIMQFKMNGVEEYISKANRHEDVPKISRNLKLCSSLIEKIKTGHYEVEYQDYYKQDIDINDDDVLIFNVIKNDLDKYFEKNKLIVTKLLKIDKNLDSREDILLAMRIGTYKHEHAKKLLFKTMFENIEQWWD